MAGKYLRPQELDEALDALRSESLAILAGGTDFYPAKVGIPLDDDILDITAIDALRGISEEEAHWKIGALTSWTDLVRADLPTSFDGLKLAAREVGGTQIQNAGTICGNICNASPAADGVPPLLSLDASVLLASVDREREMPLTEFVTGNRETQRGPDELVVGLKIPKLPDEAVSTFVKLGARKYLVISIAMVSAIIVPSGGVVGDARIAIGACSPVARRLKEAERALVGEAITSSLGDDVTEAHLKSALSPIADVRGSAEYRWDTALTLVKRAVNELGGQLENAR